MTGLQIREGGNGDAEFLTYGYQPSLENCINDLIKVTNSTRKQLNNLGKRECEIFFGHGQ
jgi:hypothetical protein